MKNTMNQHFAHTVRTVSCADWMVPDTATSLAAVICIIIGIILPIIMICK